MNIERKRAKHALEIIEELQGKSIDKYVSYVKALPATILQNGFGQAMATLLAAAKGQHDDHKRLYNQLETWLCSKNSLSPYYNQKDLMQAITSHDEQAYILAQSEAMAFLEWLKKFAVAYLSTPEEAQQEVPK